MTFLNNLLHSKPSKASITKFWTWFTENSEKIFHIEKEHEAILGSLGDELKKIHPHLTYEISPDRDDVRELIVSADGFKDAIVAVEETVKLAPEIPHWKVIAFRRPTELVTIYYGNVILPPEDLWFKAHKNGPKVDVKLFATGYLPTRRAEYTACAFLFLDHLLGEYTVMTKVGQVELDVLPPDPPEAGLKPFGELKDLFYQ